MTCKLVAQGQMIEVREGKGGADTCRDEGPGSAWEANTPPRPQPSSSPAPDDDADASATESREFQIMECSEPHQRRRVSLLEVILQQAQDFLKSRIQTAAELKTLQAPPPPVEQPPIWLQEREPEGSAELREPWKWGDDVAEAETAEVSTRGPAGRDLVEALHDLAQRLQTDLVDKEPVASSPWFTPRWLGLDRNFWLCTLGYQGAVLALLRAVLELLGSSWFAQEREVTKDVIARLKQQCIPLEEDVRSSLGTRHPEAQHFFEEQLETVAVDRMRRLLQSDPFFVPASLHDWASSGDERSSQADSDVDVVMMALHAQGAIVRLGPEAVSCPPFSALVQVGTSTLLQQIGQMVPVQEVYARVCRAGIRQEFLAAFGERAGTATLAGEPLSERDAKRKRGMLPEAERAFWVEMVEELLQGAMEREGVYVDWQRWKVQKEPMKEELAVFGFFAALGRMTRAYLVNLEAGELDENVAALVRYLEGGCVLFLPELGNLLRYQLFVDVVCEEMGWLPIYPGASLRSLDSTLGAHKEPPKRIRKRQQRLGILAAEKTIARWLNDFARHSTWLQDRPDSLAGRFVSESWKRLTECVREKSNTKKSTEASKEGGVKSDDDEVEVRGGNGEVELEELEEGQWEREDRGHDRERANRDLTKLGQLTRELQALTKDLEVVESVVQRLERAVEARGGRGGSGVSERKLAAARAEVANLRRLRSELSEVEERLQRLKAERETQLQERQALVERARVQREAAAKRRAEKSKGGRAAEAGPEVTLTGRGRSRHRAVRRLNAKASGGVARSLSPAWPIQRWMGFGEAPSPQHLQQKHAAEGPAPLSGIQAAWTRRVRSVSPSADRKASSSDGGVLRGDAEGGYATDDDEGSLWGEEGAAGEEEDLPIAGDEEARHLGQLRAELDHLTGRIRQHAPDAAAKLPPPIPGGAQANSGKGGPLSASGVQQPAGQLVVVPAVGERMEDWLEDAEPPAKKKRSFLTQSVDAVTETSADFWRGAQLLGTDLVVSLAMLQRIVTGRRFTAREKRILKRTFIDVASIIPIGIIMIIPLSPVGHGAVFAIIQRWFPALFPSSFRAERLDVARQLEQMQLLEPPPVGLDANAVEAALEEAAADAESNGNGSSSDDERQKGTLATLQKL
eukprot:TRINITY_DN5523_c0_g2_i4.p1 TRINITY_DN5523_c0_g2~~TRINITY_DN5523_c0_g2_i4.p1  ORF type:complete len:1141 (+),score=313.02 TRINITY_DN5523_c0_g2_i4:195-3617(+)